MFNKSKMSPDRLFISSKEMRASKKEAEIMAKALIKEIKLKYDEQIEAEQEYLANYRWSCPPSVNDSIMELNSSKEFEVVSENEEYLVLDQDDLKALSCVAKDLTLFEEPGYRNGTRMVKEYIKDVRLIGKPSVDGYAMSAHLSGRKPIVLKAPRGVDKYTNASVDHELVVGKILNSLRSMIPNFAFMLGSFKCGPPVVSPSSEKRSNKAGKVLSWCRGGEEVKYLIYENITNSVTVEEYCKNCSAEDYMAVLIQTMYALNVAYREHGFTHYDLHGQNVLFRKVENFDQFYIPYGGDFVYAEGIVTIIDYGRSHVLDPDSKRSYGLLASNGPRGNAHLFGSAHYMDQSHPIMDCYKFTNYTLSKMRRYNKEVYDKVKGILYYFFDDDEDIDDILRDNDLNSISSRGSPSFVKKIKKFYYEYFIKYCREFCSKNKIADPVESGRNYENSLDDFVVFPGSNGTLRSVSNVEKTLDKFERLEDYFDYIEDISRYSEYMTRNNEKFGGDSKTSHHNRINNIMLDRIKKRNLVDLFNKEERNLIDKINSVVNFEYKKLYPSDMRFLKNGNNLRKYLNSLEDLVIHIENLDNIESKLEMLSYICTEVFESKCVDLEFLETEFSKVDERKTLFNLIYQDIVVFEDYLNNINKEDDYDEKFKEIVDSLYSIIPLKY